MTFCCVMKDSSSDLNTFCVINIFFSSNFKIAFLGAALQLKTKTNTDNWINHHAAPATLWGKCCTVAMESSVARQWVDYHGFYIRGRAVFLAVCNFFLLNITKPFPIQVKFCKYKHDNSFFFITIF